MLLKFLARHKNILFNKFIKYDIVTKKKIPLEDEKQNENKYFLIPTNFPIFPNYTYVTRVSKVFADFFTKHKIKYVVAFPLQQNIKKVHFYPSSLEQFQQQIEYQKEQEKQQTALQQLMERNFVYDDLINELDQNNIPISKISKISDIYELGSLCRIFFNMNQKFHTAYLRADLRLKINPEDYLNKQKFYFLTGKTIKAQYFTQATTKYKQIKQIYLKLKQQNNINLPEISQNFSIKSIQLLSGFLCTTSVFNRREMFNLFECINIANRFTILQQFYQKYFEAISTEFNHLKQKFGKPLSQKQEKQKYKQINEYIKKMLNLNINTQFLQMVQKQLATRTFPQEVISIIQYELKTISQLGQGNPQSNKKKNFIQLLIAYPFGIKSQDNYDIQKAQKILDEDHYGMKDVKKRILEFIAVGKLKGQFKSKVILLYGPPGVGKTSIAKSIAKCLGRSYARISLGGQHDPSIMKGHRKTYVGAYPGKIFDSIKHSKTQNPVILLDQIDKIQQSYRGNLQDTIMEILDPFQNKRFKDQYVDVQIDLSNVLFICTANTLDTIFPPLLDRLERIQVNGYTLQQKKQIFKQYLVKKALENSGLQSSLNQVTFSEQVLNLLIDGYCREPGVRSLNQQINKLFQKLAFLYVKQGIAKKQILKQDLKTYLGLPKFSNKKLFPSIPPAGVIIGLAYTGNGGTTLYIEASKSNLQTTQVQPKTPTKQTVGTLMVTGNLKDVMKQSCQLAFSYAKYILSTFFNNYYLQRNDIHLNFPEIQIGKDGPSAGIAITSSLISLALNIPMIKQIAMTGQINLSGNVLPIGGVKQKILGARRQGISHLIFPLENKNNVDQLDDFIKQGITFKFVSHYFEVLHELFGINIQNKGN